MSHVKPGEPTAMPPYPLGTQPPEEIERELAPKTGQKNDAPEDDRDDEAESAADEPRPPDDS